MRAGLCIGEAHLLLIRLRGFTGVTVSSPLTARPQAPPGKRQGHEYHIGKQKHRCVAGTCGPRGMAPVPASRPAQEGASDPLCYRDLATLGVDAAKTRKLPGAGSTVGRPALLLLPTVPGRSSVSTE